MWIQVSGVRAEGSASGCSMLSVGHAGVKRNTLLLLRSSMTKHHPHLPETSRLALSAQGEHAHAHTHAGTEDHRALTSMTRKPPALSNNLIIDGANLSGCHRRRDENTRLSSGPQDGMVQLLVLKLADGNGMFEQ